MNINVKNVVDKYDCAFAISGSGSTMLIISKDLEFLDELKKLGLDIKTLEVGSGVKMEDIYEG